MFGLWLAETRLRRPRRAGLAGLLTLVLLVSGAGVRGQAPVDMRVNLRADRSVQTARLLGVNPQLGARGYNYARPMSPLVGGNAIASGLAGRGLSLRSVSPIADTTAFRAPLGTGSLYTFRRDSVSVATSPLGSGAFAQPFYDPATTVPTGGFLQGFSGPRMGDTGTSGPVDGRLQVRMDPRGGLWSQITGIKPPASPPELPGPLATWSSIFGTEPPPRLHLQPPSLEQQLPWRRWSPDGTTERGPARSVTEREDGRLDLRLPTPEDVLGTPLDTVLRSDLYPRTGFISPSGEVLTWTGRPGVIVPEPEAEVALEPTTPAVQRITDPSVLPGFDVFTDMQLAVALLSDPNAPWFREMQQALREQPELAEKVEERLAQDATEFAEQMLNTPLKSLTGDGASALNDQMLKAESLMDIGRYTEAINRYESAHLIDPSNPLPLIGKGHALLAQGNYRSAALALLRGIEVADRYPGLAPALFGRLDLTALMGGGEVIDIRRADIMRQLEQRESPELRFLLGYLEYHTGDRDRGMRNLKRAAENPRSGPTIGRYPRLLGHAGALPQPARGQQQG